MTCETFTVHLPLDLADKVDQIAARHGVSFDVIVQQALRAWLEHEDASHRMTLEALADVDAGRVVSHDVIKAIVSERLDP